MITDSKIKNLYCKEHDVLFNADNMQLFNEHQYHKTVPIYDVDYLKGGYTGLWCYKCNKATSTKEDEIKEHSSHKDFVTYDNRTPEEKQKAILDNIKNPVKQEVKKINEDENTKDERSVKRKCYDYIYPLLNGNLIKSEENPRDVYALVTKQDKLEVLDLQSTRAQYWVNYTFKENEKEVQNSAFYKDVITDYIAEAQMNGTETRRIYLRISQLENTIYYNLANIETELVRITKDNIEIVKFNKDLPLFKQGQMTQEQVRPNLQADRTDFDKFVSLFNLIDDNEKILFSVHLISLFLEKCAVPIPFWDGMAGSFKSTNTALIKLLIDPSGKSLLSNRQAMPKEDKDLVLSLNDQYLCAYYNICYI